MLGVKRSERRDGAAPTSEGDFARTNERDFARINEEDVKMEDEETPPGSNHHGGNPESLSDSSNGCAFCHDLLHFVLLRVCTFGSRIDNYMRNERTDRFSTVMAIRWLEPT